MKEFVCGVSWISGEWMNDEEQECGGGESVHPYMYSVLGHTLDVSATIATRINTMIGTRFSREDPG